jgi:transcriptional regulator with XRE-family HTH domain
VHPTEPDQGEFARALARIQKRTGFSDQRIADAAGVNRSQVWRWLHAGSAPGYEPVRRVAAHVTAERPDLAADAASLLPAAGYDAPPAGPPDEPHRPRLPAEIDPGPELDKYELAVRREVDRATEEFGWAATGAQVFPASEQEQRIWDSNYPLRTRAQRIGLIALVRMVTDPLRGHCENAGTGLVRT